VIRQCLQEGNQNDRVDARKLAELLQNNQLRPVYHGDHGLRALKELVRSYLTITKDLSRVMTRVKAIYRSWAIPCSGKQVYAARYRAEWLGKIGEPGVRRRAELYYQQLDGLRLLRLEVRKDLVAESKKHKIWKRLSEIPSLGPIRAAVLLGIVQTAQRFRTQATVLDLLRVGHRGAQQRRSSCGERPARTEEEAYRDSRAEQELQSRSQEFVQERCGGRLEQAGPVRRVLRSFSQ
jgi:transposase